MPGSLPRPRSQGSLPGGLVTQARHFVTSIAVVSRQGSLLSLTSSDSGPPGPAEARNPRVAAAGPRASPLLAANAGFVTSVQFGSLSLERGRAGPSRRGPRPALDSLVTGSLLSLTRPREAARRPGPGKLSSYVLEEREEPRPGVERDEFDTNQLSATVLDKGEELTSLYRTISRKRLLRQYKDFPAPPCPEEGWGPEPGDPGRRRRREDEARAGARPLARILDRLHSLQTAENTYVSLTSDSLYTSLQVRPRHNLVLHSMSKAKTTVRSMG
jgi:hypothetical protein